MATNPAGDIGQPAYDPEFLKSLGGAPKPVAANLPESWRKVAVKATEMTTPRPTMWQRVSSLLKSNVSNAHLPQPGGTDYEVTLDLSHQVLRLDIPEEYDFGDLREAPKTKLFPSFADAPVDASLFAPAAALALKAKQFDDGLYACVELAAESGLSPVRGRTELILQLLQALVTESDGAAASLLTAAAQLGGQQPQVSGEVAQQADALRQEFLANELRSKVLGFYTWSEELARIFQRDRMLQAEIKEPAARALASALAQNDELLRTYGWHLHLAEKLTNPLVWDHLLDPATALKEGRIPIFSQRMSFFPPSRAHETELIKKLFENRPIPDGFDLAEEMIKRLQDGSLDLSPTSASGWYDHQTYALEALAVPERTPEAKRLSLTDSYRKELRGLFKALLALTRETHIKQLEVPMCGSAGGWSPPKAKLFIPPGLTLEPLATYYLRRAHSYRFVHDVLDQAFGAKALEQARRLTAEGPVNLSLGEELRLMQAIFHGAYLRVCTEIGLAAEATQDGETSNHENDDRSVLEAWLASVRKDPDLGRDVRMMVPVFFDLGRKKTKVWVVPGIAERHLTVSYVNPPVIKEIKDPFGRVVRPGEIGVEFVSDFRQTAYFATAEVYVTRLLDRKEFREHCDRHKTFNAIISNLE